MNTAKSKEAVEAVKWYVSLFDNSSIQSIMMIPNTPSGDTVVLDFQLSNIRFNAINAGPYFTFNPSISLMVACNSVEEVECLHPHNYQLAVPNLWNSANIHLANDALG